MIEVEKVIEANFPGIPFEHLIIDNASTDGTVDALKVLQARHPQIRVIVNSRNYDVERSFFHGIKHCNGQVVIPILADLQTPTELIPLLVKKWEEGSPLVLAVRGQSDETFTMRLMRRSYYSLLRRFSRVNHLNGFYGFGLYDQEVIEQLRPLNDQDPFFRGIVLELGFPYTTVSFDQPRRRTGHSKHSVFKLVEHGSAGLVNYSSRPLLLIVTVAISLGLVGLAFAVLYLILKLLWWESFDIGVAPLLISTMLFGSVQLFSIGLVGLYVDAILKNVKPRPPLTARETFGVSRLTLFEEEEST